MPLIQRARHKLGNHTAYQTTQALTDIPHVDADYLLHCCLTMLAGDPGGRGPDLDDDGQNVLLDTSVHQQQLAASLLSGSQPQGMSLCVTQVRRPVVYIIILTYLAGDSPYWRDFELLSQRERQEAADRHVGECFFLRTYRHPARPRPVTSVHSYVPRIVWLTCCAVCFAGCMQPS